GIAGLAEVMVTVSRTSDHGQWYSPSTTCTARLMLSSMTSSVKKSSATGTPRRDRTRRRSVISVVISQVLAEGVTQARAHLFRHPLVHPPLVVGLDPVVGGDDLVHQARLAPAAAHPDEGVDDQFVER